ncbi:bola protein [Phaeosphaeriaceae sp. PMI808]|nr:bola protein [Phaeosphaeriaceae sp. PMI808]
MQPQIRPMLRLWSPPAVRPQCSAPVSVLKPCLSHQVRRAYSQQGGASPEPPDYLNDAELHVFNKIKATLEPVKLEVRDVSGGCGSMYAIEVESPKFRGLTVVKQHKLVNQVLKEEISQWHGVQLRTRVA